MSIEAASLVLNVDSTDVKNATKEMEAMHRAGASLEADLARQLALHGRAGKAAAARYDTEFGALSGLDVAHKKRILNLATELDRTERLTKEAKSLGLALGTVITVGGGFLLKGFIENTIQAEEATAQLEARLRSTGGVSGMTLKSLQDLASGLQDITKFDDEAIAGSEALLLTFTKVGSDIFPRATQAILDTATALGSDLNSATMLIGKALNDPIKGMTAMTRAGVQFSDSQKTLIKNLVKTGDVAGAQRIILKELETQMGGSAVAAGKTLGGAVAQLKNAFGELLEGDTGSEGVIGVKSAIEDLTTTMKSDEVKGGFNALITGAAQAASAFARLVMQVTGGVKVIAENMAALAHGAAIGDAVRLDNELDAVTKRIKRVQELQKRGPIGRVEQMVTMPNLVRQNAPNGGDSNPQEELDFLIKQKAATEGKIKATNEFAAAATAAAAAVANAPKPPSGDPTDPGDPGAATKAAKAAADKAAQAAKDRAEELLNLKDSLRTEEEVIQASYDERSKIIASHKELSAAAMKDLSDRSKAQYDKEMEDLRASKGAELKDLEESMRSEEQVMRDSYEARLKIVNDNTEAGSAKQIELQAKVTEMYAKDVQAYKDAIQAKLDAASAGLLTDAEQLQKSYDDQRAVILAATEGNELARQDLLRRLQDKFHAEEVQREQDKNMAIAQVASNMFGSLAALAETYAHGSSKRAKKAFEMQKSLSIAQAIINTYQSATGAYNAMVGIPYVGPVLAAAAATAAVIAGIANVRQIQSQTYSEHDQGGRIAAGKIGIVGEYGPEFVRGPAAITARQLTQQTLNGAGKGGGGINFNSTFNINGDSTTSESSGSKENNVRAFKELVDSRFRDLVNQEQRAGGSLWRMKHG